MNRRRASVCPSALEKKARKNKVTKLMPKKVYPDLSYSYSAVIDRGTASLALRGGVDA